ncbi:MAG: DNA-directed RNA polymerase subunit alpha [Spirochaetales bacterium]|jgi:DNA-directed RNA polymerase subunit alpha|nr:DNA-directed RNA polymerase subunit alpha [Spirochaetales bacterium]
MARKNLLKGFKRPKGITFEHSEVTPSYGKFVAYPFERGFGTTIGNTLRRILLSSIQGYAVTSVRITWYNKEGTAHLLSSEYESIPGVVEDTPDIINNLKLVQLRLEDGLDQKTIALEVKGSSEVKGGDLQTDDAISVFNKDLHIATTMDDANFEIEIQIDLGRGYIPAEVNDKYIEIIGTIPMDAVFSPIRKVRYVIEDTRVGQRSDYDKLIMEIWTNGSISPEDALAEAAKIAKDHFTIFINFDEDVLETSGEIDEEEESVRKLLETPVEELELSVRSSNCLKNANIRTIGALTMRTEDDIAKTRNFGKKSLLEIKDKLKEWNLTLGMTDYSALKKAIKSVKKKKEDTDEA